MKTNIDDPPDDDAKLTWSKDQTAAHLGISIRHLERLVSQGRMAPPLRLGRRIRFAGEAVRAWVAAGGGDSALPAGSKTPIAAPTAGSTPQNGSDQR